MFKGFLTYMGAVALTLKLIYSHCLIRFNISSEIMTLASTVFKKSTFQKNSHLNAIEGNLTLMLSRSRST